MMVDALQAVPSRRCFEPVFGAALVALVALGCVATTGCDRSPEGDASGAVSEGEGATASTANTARGGAATTAAATTATTTGSAGGSPSSELPEGTQRQRVLLSKARMAFLSGENDKAEQHFLELLQTDEFSGPKVTAMIALAEIRLARGEREQAFAIYDKLLEIAPGLAEVQLVVGRAYAGAGENERAISALERALEIQPDFIFLHAELGALYAEAGRTEKSAEAYLTYEKRLYKMAGQLEDPEEVSPQMRLHIVDVFSMVDDERAARALLEALDDPAPPVRRAAAMTLGQLQVAEAREPLAALERDDPSYQVRMAARTALQNLEGVESPPKPAPPAPEGPSLEREGHDRDPGRAQ